MEEFVACFADLEDPRESNARHDLHEMLLIALCAVLCGAEDCSDMALFGRAKETFFREFLRLRHGIPSHDTFSRLFRHLDPVAFHGCFLGFMRRFAETVQGVVAVDGKSLRRSFDRATGQAPLHLVCAWAVGPRLVLGQLAVEDESNEITAVPQLLALLSLQGRIVTADALHCQRAIADQVVQQGGDYVLALKGNQGRLHADVAQFLDDPETAPDSTATTVDADHGRIETRTGCVSTDVTWLKEQHDWPGLAAIGKVTRRREGKAGTTTETAYYLLSAALPAARFNAVVRQHWGIENGLHWVLDVTMDEDRATNRRDNGPQNLALLRRLALNLVRLDTSKGSVKGKRKRAGWDNAFLTQLLSLFANPQRT